MKNITEKLIKIFGENLVSVVLFGSRARKNYNENSDVDLIVVVKEYKEEDISKFRRNYLLKFSNNLDLQIFSKKDIINNFENFSPLFVTLLLGKKILFDRNMFFSDAFDNFTAKMINQNIKYCEGEKIWQMREIAKNLMILQ